MPFEGLCPSEFRNNSRLKPSKNGYVTNKLLPEGKHPALVAEKHFKKVSGVEDGKAPQGVTATHDDLLLKTFLKDEEIGSPFTGYIAKKGIIPYYKTRLKEKAVNINANKVNETFANMLSLFQIGGDLAREIGDELIHRLSAKIEEQLAEEKYIFDKIEAELYHKYKAKFDAEIRQIEKQLSSAPIKSSNR